MAGNKKSYSLPGTACIELYDGPYVFWVHSSWKIIGLTYEHDDPSIQRALQFLGPPRDIKEGEINNRQNPTYSRVWFP